MTVLLTMAALIAPAHHHDACNTPSCEHRVHAKTREHTDYRLRHRCNHSVVACIDRAAHLHRVDRWALRRRAFCESRFDPGASNGTHFGLFQFGMEAWYRLLPVRYSRHSPFSAKWASLGAAYAQARGHGGEWKCA